MQNKFEQSSFLLMLLLVTLLFFYLLKPFFGVIFWACVVGVLFYPLQQKLLKIWGQHPNLTAVVALMICLVIVVIPALFVIGSFFKEGVALYQRLQSGEIDPGLYLDQIRKSFPVIQDIFERLDIDPNNLKEQLAGTAIATSGLVAHNAMQLGQGTLQFFMGLGLMLYVAFFMLRDGPKLIALLVRALPLGDERGQLLFAKFVEVTRATVKGSLAVAAVQGSLGGLIFWVLNIHGALLWGVVMVVLSLIPVIGAGLIWAPVAIYLLAVGEWVKGFILIAFGVGIIGLVDNILRPILVGRDTKLPDYIVLLSTLGGFVVFGTNGFVIGPLVAALFAAFWEIFIREFNTNVKPEKNTEEIEKTS
jgi:predicted PurR-regulated permease PerM